MQRCRLQLSKVLPIFERVRELKDLKEGFKAMKKLTMSESVRDLYRLNQLRRCWYEGLLVQRDKGLRKKDVIKDIEELYSKKLVARALTGFVQYMDERRKRSMLNQLA